MKLSVFITLLCTSSAAFFGLVILYMVHRNSGQLDVTYQSFHQCISQKDLQAYSLPTSRQKVPENNVYLFADESVAPVITA